jgi:hypothetical protein
MTRPQPRSWPLERARFALAGTLTLASIALAITVKPWFLALTAFVGLNQWLFAAAGDRPASVVLRHACGLQGGWRR